MTKYIAKSTTIQLVFQNTPSPPVQSDLAVMPGITVGTLRQEYPLLQDKNKDAQERQPRITGPDPRGQVPNLRGPDLGLYKWKLDLQEA